MYVVTPTKRPRFLPPLDNTRTDARRWAAAAAMAAAAAAAQGGERVREESVKAFAGAGKRKGDT